MGVQNLLPLLAPVSKTVSLFDFKGKRMAIDGFVWLHKASFRCAKDIVHDPGSEKILPYLMNLLNKIISCGIIPVIVFDGQQLPQKEATNAKRHQERAEARVKALELESLGLNDQAYIYYQKAVEITSSTVFVWVQKLREINVEYIVAPYEADAQLAFLCRSSYVDCVLTEDSDLLVYKNPITLFKYDASNQTAVMILYDDILSHLQLSSYQFTALCCYSGCDYIDRINKLGLQTALKLIKVHNDPFEMLNSIKAEGKFIVPDTFEEQLKNAMLTYKCQKVFDPRTKKLITLEPIENPPDFLGPDVPRDLLLQIITCDIDTRTYAKLRPEPPTGSTSPYFKKKPEQKLITLNTDENKSDSPPKKSSSKFFTSYKKDNDSYYKNQKKVLCTSSYRSYLQFFKSSNQ